MTPVQEDPQTVNRCDDDFYCGECEDCLMGEHPENRPRRAALEGTSHD